MRCWEPASPGLPDVGDHPVGQRPDQAELLGAGRRRVREAAHVAAGIVTAEAPDLASTLHPALAGTPPPAGDELRLVGALTNRMVAYVATGEELTLPAPRASSAD